jgi:hypothetical protein
MVSPVIPLKELAAVTKQDKREQRIRLNPANVPLQDFENLINRYGRITTNGSHFKAVIRKKSLPYKRENPVKLVYVKDILKLIDKIQEDDNE